MGTNTNSTTKTKTQGRQRQECDRGKADKEVRRGHQAVAAAVKKSLDGKS